MMYDIPILILTYNRPNHLLKLIRRLKKINPKKIYVSCDGPKNNFDESQILKIKKKIQLFDRRTKIHLNLLNKNYGIKYGPQKGIDWYFKNENLGIILEDDCIPSDFFFKYMKYLLYKYKDDKKVYAISGYNHLKKTNFGEGTYFLSNYFLCWGWGTWKVVWENSDKELTSYIKGKSLIKLKNKFQNDLEYKYWQKVIKHVYHEKIKTWDIQFLASMWKKNSYCILPNINMIKNIGFDQTSTTSPGLNFKVAKVVNYDGKIINPRKLSINAENENQIFLRLFRPKNFLYPWRIFNKLKEFFLQPKYFMRKVFKF